MKSSYLRSLAERTLESAPRLRPILPALYGHTVVTPQPLVEPSEASSASPRREVMQPLVPVAHDNDRTARASESTPTESVARAVAIDKVSSPREQLEKTAEPEEPRTSIERRILEFVEVQHSIAAHDDPDLVLPPTTHPAPATPLHSVSKRARPQSRSTEPTQTIFDSDPGHQEKEMAPGPIHVHIGRIDLRAVHPSPPAQPPRRPSEPARKYLEEYIRAREDGLR